MSRFVTMAVTAASLGLGFFETASAADMPVKAPVVYKAPLAVASNNWSGWYVGINAGYGVARNPTTFNQNDPVFGQWWNESFVLSPKGVVGGGQIGYNWMMTPTWLVGLEADLQGTGMTSGTTCTVGCNLVNNAQTASHSQKLPWFGTLRGRLGWVNGPSLLYVTGGWAYGKVETSSSEQQQVFNPQFSSQTSNNKSGWALGGGVETMLSGNWTTKFEYLYIDLGNVTNQYADTAYCGGPSCPMTISSDIREHIFRVGLNYRFGGAMAGSAYNVPTLIASHDWTGWYAGINAGYGIASNPSTFTQTVPGATPPNWWNESFVLSPSGFVGGGQIGYNWMWTPTWLVGLEADLQGTGMTSGTTCTVGCNLVNNAQTASHSQKLPWFGTLRGRLGWVNGASLLYATGGLAYGKVETSSSEQFGINPTFTGNFSDTKSGWALGGGLETALSGNWTIKAEYLYVDLGSVSHQYTDTASCTFGPCTNTISSDVREHVVRVGLNYKLGGPVIAKY